MRRTFQKADKGQIYCIEWPEWHVECAEPGCDHTVMMSPLGLCTTLKEAEKAAKENDSGWKRHDGLWFCPEHAKAAGGAS